MKRPLTPHRLCICSLSSMRKGGGKREDECDWANQREEQQLDGHQPPNYTSSSHSLTGLHHPSIRSSPLSGHSNLEAKEKKSRPKALLKNPSSPPPLLKSWIASAVMCVSVLKALECLHSLLATPSNRGGSLTLVTQMCLYCTGCEVNP